ncbi:hypothetical protein ACFWBR_31530 [Streptomyces sp. NPDC060006]|uniref:hypothetical protein n=1 Tax=unclassified Streptomyces TaxID=2593676 RepID=UPI0036A0631E
MTTKGTQAAGTGPVGHWRARVGRRGRWTTSVFRFGTDGRALLLEGGTGTGIWWDLGAGRFAFRVLEPLHTDDGRAQGWVVIEQTAVLAGPGPVSRSVPTGDAFAGSDPARGCFAVDAFTSTGLSTVHDGRGTVLRRLPVRINAVTTRPAVW